ncbi:uncharacterized protein LOC115881606 [Sitophilus oryzae]|uniref:Uncharacterized protein LOC115881606 n=1 Tax=Sitophilus oryzae TaxID=7048 RepID=A0A6J2XU08_SITOR|nr:uncharacterized protein LOC115881606 [Sitophilus oryzae]
MKTIAILFFLISVSWGTETSEFEAFTNDIVEVNLNEVIPIELKEKLLQGILTDYVDSLKESYSADVTSYANEILANVGAFILEQGLDPVSLPDESIKVLTSTFHLTEGSLESLSTIGTYDNVIVYYNSDTKILDLTLPISFEKLVIKYKYRTKVLLVTVKGDVTAKITDVKANLNLGFNFSSYQVFAEKVNLKHSGNIHIDITGLGVLDYLLDAMTTVLTTLFHNLILKIVDNVIDTPVQSIVTDLNNIINNILHPNSGNNTLFY